MGIDTPLFIYGLERNPTYVDVVNEFLVGLEQGILRGVTSIVTLTEISVRPLQVGNRAVADQYAALLHAYPNLTVLDVTRPIARRAAELRARYRLRPMDSLQVATALVAGADAYLSNLRGLQRIAELPVLVLDDLRPPH